MYSFLVYAGRDGKQGAAIVGKAADITRRVMPSLGCSLGVCRREFAEINGGWFFLYPEEVSEGRLVSEFVDETAAVLVFGEMVRQGRVSAGEVVARAWKEGGVDAAASIVACDWSLGGKALLKDLNVCDPNEHVSWSKGKVEVVRRPLIVQEERIEAGDRKGIEQQVDMMIEKMRDDARYFSGDEPEVQVELTAGMDSRMVTAVLLSVVESSRICAVTGGGGADNHEVKTARRMAEKYGFGHRCFAAGGEQAGESFVPFSRLLAFVSNGTTNSKRAIYSMPRLDVASHPTFVGNGGEIYAGFYTPSPLKRPVLSEYSTGDVLRNLSRKLPGIGRLEWCDEEMADKLAARLACSVELLKETSSAPGDILSLFYLYERYCRWGSGTARRTFVRKRYSLYNSPELVKLAYRLPSPISQNGLLHRTAIKRYMPEAYRWLVNRTKYMPMFDYPRAAKAFSEVMIRANRARDAVVERLGRTGRKKSHEQATGDLFSGGLGDLVREMLLAKDSLSMQILRKEWVEGLVEEHVSGRKNNIHAIGWLATLEQWKKLVGEAASGGVK